MIDGQPCGCPPAHDNLFPDGHRSFYYLRDGTWTIKSTIPSVIGIFRCIRKFANLGLARNHDWNVYDMRVKNKQRKNEC